MDKLMIQFFTDVLYIKGVINSAEHEAILDCRKQPDFDLFVDAILRGDFNAKKGESYKFTSK